MVKMKTKIFLLVMLLFGLIGGCGPILTAQTVTLDTRPRITTRVLLMTPKASPMGVLILFPGGPGNFTGRSKTGEVWDFLVRSSDLFVERGFVVAIVDVPSDQRGRMSVGFRRSKEHVEDIKKILDFLHQRWMSPIFLIGQSLGALSVGHLALSLNDNRISGIILTSSSRGALTMPLENIDVPVLFVHHRDDGCVPFNYALTVRGGMIRSPKAQLIEVLGGDPPASAPCEPWSPHGFLGKEREVVNAITEWILGRPVPDKIF